MEYDRNLLYAMGFEPLDYDEEYPPLGNLYFRKTNEGKFFYWMYEGDHFTLNIHDFRLTEESLFDFKNNHMDASQLSVSYLVEASGDLFIPKRNLIPGQILAYFIQNRPFRGIIHNNSRFLTVGYEYRYDYLEEHVPDRFSIPFEDIEEACSLLNSRPELFSLGKLSSTILHHRKNIPTAKLFYDHCAREALWNILSVYYEHRGQTIPGDDKKALEMVAETIDEHYMMEHSLDFLAKMACMSKSKLKTLFKKHYGMTITEYTQRRRIHVAKHLLMSTHLPIGHVAEAVGYRSHGRFSALFKKYVGVFPRDWKKNDGESSPSTNSP